MNVKISLDNAAVERRSHTLEDVHMTIKNLVYRPRPSLCL